MVMAAGTVIVAIVATFLVALYMAVWPPKASPQRWRRLTRPLRRRIFPRRYERL